MLASARVQPGCAPETWPGPAEAAVPRGPADSPATRPPPPTRLSLPPESASSPVTAERGDPGSLRPLPAWELRSEAWADRALAGKLLPTLSRAHCPWRPGLGVSPSRGVRPAHPPPHPPAHGGLPCTPVSKGPCKGLVPPATRAPPGREEPVSTDGPDHPGRLGQHVPSQPNRQRPETLETGAALAAAPTGHAGVHSPALPHQGPHPGGTAGPSHTCVPHMSTHSEA